MRVPPLARLVPGSAVVTLLALSATAYSPRTPDPSADPVAGGRGIARQDAAAREHFEARIRPVLIEHCSACHFGTDAEAGLRLDWRAGMRTPSANGTAIVPGDPDASLLLDVLRHARAGLEMPRGGERLAATVVADFEHWIRTGAFDPRDAPPVEEAGTQHEGWSTKLERRKDWWSLRPIRAVAPPPATPWSAHPLDRFVAADHARDGLTPSPRADRRTLIRRLSLALTGLLPAPERVEAFAYDARPDAYERLVDELLASPHFGERWARHWMDLVRYADSHGSEGDPAIPNAFRYRDYLIRAFNADLPYDQLVVEHVAGDLLAAPRIDAEAGRDESAIGTAHWRMVFHGFAPTDALDEKVRFVDDQINVFGKAFLGQTIACARCHDHKFDAISQADYTALYGILASSRPAMRDVDLPARRRLHAEALEQRKEDLRAALSSAWLQDLETGRVAARLRDLASASDGSAGGALLRPWHAAGARVERGETPRAAWTEVLTEIVAHGEEARSVAAEHDRARWSFGGGLDGWYADGNDLERAPSAAGAFALHTDGDRIVRGVYPAGAYTHLPSTKHRGVLQSARLDADRPLRAWMLLAGGGQSRARYVVQDYPRGGTVYPIQDVRGDAWAWHAFDLSYWEGDRVHFELATARDAVVEVRAAERSWFGAREVVVRPAGAPGPRDPARDWEQALRTDSIPEHADFASLSVELYVSALATAIEGFADGSASDAGALLLDAALRAGLLRNSTHELSASARLVEDYRALEAKVPVPTRVPGLAEADAEDHPLFVRGDHRRPAERVPRRFLAALDPTPYEPSDSGRLQLAHDVVAADNPLTARVAVNRVWHHLFGRGIVATPDNFGRLGARPSHPELLDWLAHRFVQDGWSLKRLVRLVVTTETWRQASDPREELLALDPENVRLARHSVRRLDAESLRDALLSVSGRLDPTLYGASVATGGGSVRRSVYVRQQRNAMDPFLEAFDAPTPFAPVGRRARTNTPAQALALMNDPAVHAAAAAWATHTLAAGASTTTRDRLARMLHEAFGRPATARELEDLASYLERERAQAERDARRVVELERRDEELTRAIAAILDPVRADLLAARGSADVGIELRPLARWDFTRGLEDLVGELDASLHGSAVRDARGLVLDGNGHASTGPLGVDLHAKTLEAWVRLATLDQAGGAAVGVQDLRGNAFDALVFAERRPRRWLAGSDHFRRTRDFDGVDEAAALERPVALAVVYGSDGTVQAYRDGAPYGAPYASGGPQAFRAGDAQVLFGLRHGAPAPGRLLSGTVVEARLYDRALSPEEVAASAAGSPVVTRAEVLAALPEPTRADLRESERERAAVRVELAASRPTPHPDAPWRRVALALFNAKEFSHVR